jgi:outer membrane protein OmpA-like peptidoglycan-associated protein
MGSGTAAREEASEDFATMSNPAAPPPPPAVSETQSRDSRVLNQSYDSDSRRGRAVSPPRQTAVPEEVQSARSDDRNATSTPIMPPQQQIQSEVKEKSMAALDSQDQAPRQYADAPKDQDGSYRQQPANALGKRNGKPTVATPPPAGTITQLGDAYFDPDRATLKESSQQSLDYLVDLMNSYPDMRVEIQGHTDGDGSDDRNYLLSESRARSVKEYLRRKGIAPARMEIQGFGPAEPLAPNTTALGKKLNRRVVVKVKDYSYSNSGTLRK